MKLAVLALQGAFEEHRKKLESLGAACTELRSLSDLTDDLSGLVLPGGESTVQGKLLNETGLLLPLRDRIRAGMPVLATCAGLILLAEKLSNDSHVYFGTLPVTVRRNAYGRQLGSFHTEAGVRTVGTVPMTFIRAPFIEEVRDGTEVLSVVRGNIVAVRYGRQTALSFHPELDADNRIHEAFLEDCAAF